MPVSTPPGSGRGGRGPPHSPVRPPGTPIRRRGSPSRRPPPVYARDGSSPRGVRLERRNNTEAPSPGPPQRITPAKQDSVFSKPIVDTSKDDINKMEAPCDIPVPLTRKSGSGLNSQIRKGNKPLPSKPPKTGASKPDVDTDYDDTFLEMEAFGKEVWEDPPSDDEEEDTLIADMNEIGSMMWADLGALEEEEEGLDDDLIQQLNMVGEESWDFPEDLDLETDSEAGSSHSTSLPSVPSMVSVSPASSTSPVSSVSVDVKPKGKRLPPPPPPKRDRKPVSNRSERTIQPTLNTAALPPRVHYPPGDARLKPEPKAGHFRPKKKRSDAVEIKIGTCTTCRKDTYPRQIYCGHCGALVLL